MNLLFHYSLVSSIGKVVIEGKSASHMATRTDGHAKQYHHVAGIRSAMHCPPDVLRSHAISQTVLCS